MSRLAFGIFSAASADLPAYELIESTILGSNTASVTFSGLGAYASTYKHLQIRVVARTTRNDSGEDGLSIRLNGNTGTNYSSHALYGQGTTVNSNSGVSQTRLTGGQIAGNTVVTGAFAASVFDLTDVYATKNKTLRSLNGSAVSTGAQWIRLVSGLFNNTSSLTTVLLFPEIGPNFLAGSRFSIYGIKG
jgi:hypothetical protein